MGILTAQSGRWVVSSLVAITILVFLIVLTRPAFRQPPDTVVIREPGKRFFSSPQPAQTQAAIDLDYALLSQAAYGDIKKDKPDPAAVTVDAKNILAARGWMILPNFPDQGLQNEMDGVHLRAEVWVNRSKNSIVVTFGGTVFSSLKDWKSNLHWFNPFQKDEYNFIVSKFAPSFADMVIRQRQSPDAEFFKNATLYSTGHSLGAGLAEDFAYSLPNDRSDDLRVTKVYAFDPSPVTGFLRVKSATRKANKNGLKIDRIYERGEVVAILRSITSVFHPPPVINPEVRQLRYNFFGDDKYGITNTITSHSIQDLTLGIKNASKQ